MNPPIDMTLRDYFAAKAIQSIVFGASVDNFDALAVDAYKLADSMLKKARGTPQAQPSREPLTNEEIKEGRTLRWKGDPNGAPEPWSFRVGVEWAEEKHGITKGNT